VDLDMTGLPLERLEESDVPDDGQNVCAGKPDDDVSHCTDPPLPR
jgi:hypothetical protein